MYNYRPCNTMNTRFISHYYLFISKLLLLVVMPSKRFLNSETWKIKNRKQKQGLYNYCFQQTTVLIKHIIQFSY